MIRQFTENKLVIASHNSGKVREIVDLLSGFSLETLSCKDLNLPKPIESGSSFTQNAEIKARSAAKHACLPALADDSGMEVNALNGAPGVFSARWAGPNKDFSIAMQRIHKALKNSHNLELEANLTCVLTLAWPDGYVVSYEGKVFGHLTLNPKGNRGVGFEPYFIPEGYKITFGEMESQMKQSINPRAVAFRKMRRFIFGHDTERHKKTQAIAHHN